jgi:hypothetical protein
VNRTSWILAVILALVGTAAYFLLSTGSPESDVVLNDLLAREKEKRVQAIETQVTELTEQRSAAAKEAAERIAIRPAIPELPEYPWDSTRAWNLPLNNPPIAEAADSFFLEPDDYVIGVLLGNHARAYPWYVLANYHAINDQIDGEFVIVNLCEACNGGAAFLAKTELTTIDIRPFGIKHGTWYGIDFQTGSYWYPFSGEAFEGPLKGTKLKRIRAYFTTWREWIRDHPESTVVLSNDEVRDRPHGRMGHMANELTFNPDLMARLAKSPRNPKRDQLADHVIVFGLIPKGDELPVAYEVEKLRQTPAPLQIKLGDTPILLFVQSEYQVGAYVRKFDGEELELEITSDSPLLMLDQFGNHWNAWGRTESGPHHPAELEVADGYLTKWYEWLENYPDTELVSSLLP